MVQASLLELGLCPSCCFGCTVSAHCGVAPHGQPWDSVPWSLEPGHLFSDDPPCQPRLLTPPHPSGLHPRALNSPPRPRLSHQTQETADTPPAASGSGSPGLFAVSSYSASARAPPGGFPRCPPCPVSPPRTSKDSMGFRKTPPPQPALGSLVLGPHTLTLHGCACGPPLVVPSATKATDQGSYAPGAPGGRGGRQVCKQTC